MSKHHKAETRHVLQLTSFCHLFTQMQQMVNSDSRFTGSQQPIEAALGPKNPAAINRPGQLSTINQSQLGLAANSVTHNSPSPPASKSATPSPSSSAHEDDNDDGFRVNTHTHTHIHHRLLECRCVWRARDKTLIPPAHEVNVNQLPPSLLGDSY